MPDLRETRPEKWNEETFYLNRDVQEVVLFIGQTLTDKRGDKFKILDILGKGGMGGVYKMFEERTGREVAVKFMNERARGTPALVERFKREIEVLGRLQNPFILKAYDVMEALVDGETMVGLVMEYVEGPSLQDEIYEQDGLPPERVVILAGQLAVALESLREAGLVHRDLKPTNVLLQNGASGEEFVRVGDFGVVGFAFADEVRERPFDDLRASGSLTQTGHAVGSPSFMSPEAARGARLDHRSDLYSLGLILYEMLTGEAPFWGKSAQAIMVKQQTASLPLLKDRGIHDVPEWLEKIMRTLVEKDPKDRYQSAKEVYDALLEGVRQDYPELLKEIPFRWNYQ